MYTVHYRLWLAALHFNENTERDQAITIEGMLRYKLSCPKYKKEYTARKIPVPSTFGKIGLI